MALKKGKIYFWRQQKVEKHWEWQYTNNTERKFALKELEESLSDILNIYEIDDEHEEMFFFRVDEKQFPDIYFTQENLSIA